MFDYNSLNGNVAVFEYTHTHTHDYTISNPPLSLSLFKSQILF